MVRFKSRERKSYLNPNPNPRSEEQREAKLQDPNYKETMGHHVKWSGIDEVRVRVRDYSMRLG